MVSAARERSACRDIEPLLDAAADGELLDEDRALVRTHLVTCPTCRARMDATQGLKAALRAAAAAEDLPEALEQKIRADLGRERQHHARKSAVVFVAAAGVAFAAVLVLSAREDVPAGAGSVSPAATSASALAPLVERHALDVPVDVASPDARRVALFLEPRLGRRVVVPRLDDAGWGLQGARVVDVLERRGAQLVYRGGLGERITLVELPDADRTLAARVIGADTARSLEQAGHRLRIWHRDGALHALVGDVSSERLEHLAATLDR